MDKKQVNFITFLKNDLGISDFIIEVLIKNDLIRYKYILVSRLLQFGF